MKVFLDDIREPQECVYYMYKRIGPLNPIFLEDWEIVRNYDKFKEIVSENIKTITHVSFDHDLADAHYTPEDLWDDYDASERWQNEQVYSEKTGYDCAKWMKEFYKENEIALPTIFIHSMNPVGTDRIANLFLDNERET